MSQRFLRNVAYSVQIGLLAVIRLFSGFDRHFLWDELLDFKQLFRGIYCRLLIPDLGTSYDFRRQSNRSNGFFYEQSKRVCAEKGGGRVYVICFGDSNTYGYDPRSWLGGRYDASSRWTDIVAAETGWTVCNMGQNGREIPTTAPTFPEDTDLLIVMLGTNDLLQGCSAESAIGKLEGFLAALSLLRDRILLIAPPPMMLGEWAPSQQLVNASKNFTRCCRELAEQMGIQFADAGRWNISLTYDGVHFTEQGHKAFAAGLLEELK